MRTRSYPDPGSELWHASNAGPGKWTKNEESGRIDLLWSPGGLALLLAPNALKDAKRGRSVNWLAAPSTAEDRRPQFRRFFQPGYPSDQSRAVKVQFQQGITQAKTDSYYGVFANTALWLSLHGRPHGLTPQALRESWNDYKEVNRAFAETIVREAQDGATVIVHDFQLALVGQYVKELSQDLEFLAQQRDGKPLDIDVTGYWHIPFGSPAEFLQSKSGRTDVGLPDDIARELLDAMGTGVKWGFHSPDWSANFVECFEALETNGAERHIEANHAPYVVPGFIDPERTQTLIYGLSDAQLLQRTRSLVIEHYENEDRIEGSAIFNLDDAEFAALVQEVNEADLPAVTRLAESVAPIELSELLDDKEPLVKAEHYEQIFEDLGSTYKDYLVLEKKNADGSLETPRKERRQIWEVTGRGDPKNNILVALKAYRAVLEDPEVAVKPSMLLICSRSRKGVEAYDNYWNAIVKEVRDIQKMKDSNLVHFDGAPYAVTLAAHAVSDIAIVPSERGGRDLVGIEPVAGRGKDAKPVAVVISDQAKAAETLHGAKVVKGLGPAPILKPRRSESPKAFARRQEATNAAHEKVQVTLLASALKQVMKMKDVEFQARFDDMHAAVQVENPVAWTGRLEAEAKNLFVGEAEGPHAFISTRGAQANAQPQLARMSAGSITL